MDNLQIANNHLETLILLEFKKISKPNVEDLALLMSSFFRIKSIGFLKYANDNSKKLDIDSEKLFNDFVYNECLKTIKL